MRMQTQITRARKSGQRRLARFQGGRAVPLILMTDLMSSSAKGVTSHSWPNAASIGAILDKEFHGTQGFQFTVIHR